MTTRRDFLRAGLVTAAAALVIPDETFVRRFFPVGIDLRSPKLKRSIKVHTGYICFSKACADGLLLQSLIVKPGATIVVPDGWSAVAT